jgi:hypothetical protein
MRKNSNFFASKTKAHRIGLWFINSTKEKSPPFEKKCSQNKFFFLGQKEIVEQ